MGLNPVGSFAWGLLDGRRTLSDLAAAVAAEFAVTPEQAAADLGAFVADLRDRGLVETEPEKPEGP